MSIGLLALALAACNSTEQVKAAQLQATLLCGRLAASHLGVAVAAQDDPFDVGPDRVAAPGFRFVSTAQFVIELKRLLLKGASQPATFTCTGDFTRRVLTSLQIDGTISRPAQPDDWSF